MRALFYICCQNLFHYAHPGKVSREIRWAFHPKFETNEHFFIRPYLLSSLFLPEQVVGDASTTCFVIVNLSLTLSWLPAHSTWNINPFKAVIWTKSKSTEMLINWIFPYIHLFLKGGKLLWLEKEWYLQHKFRIVLHFLEEENCCERRRNNKI